MGVLSFFLQTRLRQAVGIFALLILYEMGRGCVREGERIVRVAAANNGRPMWRWSAYGPYRRSQAPSSAGLARPSVPARTRRVDSVDR